MATLADRLKRTVYRGRAIAGTLGFRPYTVAILTERWLGQHTGESGPHPEETAITEGSSQPPKVRWLNDDEVALANLGSGAIEVGPITPLFAAGGTDLETLAGDLDRNTTRYLKITGPKHPNGARYRITSISAGRALRYMLRAVPAANEDA